MHVHTYAISEESDDELIKCDSAGPHFNPLNNDHGDIFSNFRHVGDLGNIVRENDGMILIIYS